MNSPKSHETLSTSTTRKNKLTYDKRLVVRFSGILILVALIVSGLYLGAAASGTTNTAPQSQGFAARNVKATRPQIDFGGSSPVGNWLAPILSPQANQVTVTTYAGDCTTPKTVFNVQDADKTVCAKFTNVGSEWRVIWSNAHFVAVQDTAIPANNSSTFTLNLNSSLGDWRVILFEPFGGAVQAVTTFTVIDEQNPSADVSISKGVISSGASAGHQLLYSIQVTNNGPSDAASVALTDAVPANTTFHSFGQLSGPTFTCTSPDEGDTGTTNCTITSLARGDTVIFIGTYVVDAVSTGTVISNTASVSSTTPDPSSENNSSSAEATVVNAPCQLSTPENITVSADSGQAGAVVTYATPTGSGDCGTASTGEGGETIPAISCNPVSGSFFPVGTTSVICSAKTGAAVSFQVTVDNPGALSISLNGPASITLECGQRFGDPAATAINGSGQSLEVIVSYSGGFDPDAPVVGTYTATYTATEGANSVSAERSITVADSEAPAITIAGANPYKIQQGSCSPFVDPGASAFDTCGGTKTVSSSISGPGGATSVNPAVAGTYIVTYTATDGTREATATRTVVVGTFPEDEVDQPGTTNVPPTLTLNGDDQITIECGTAFTDPGATATVCGSSVPVTTSGTVDIHTPGVYSITYSATANGFTVDATRIVTVEADNSAPTITLNGASPMTVECHTSFTDPGAIAHDACAGDFAATASGTVDANTVGVYVITYNATDPSGHSAVPVTRTVNVVDTTAPTVTAPANVTVNTGPGATSCGTIVSDATLGTGSANDSCAGSLSVTRTGVPAGNVFPVGTTTITYTANDGYNSAQAQQTVTVIDNTLPTISCPLDITLEPSCPSGAIATYTAPVGTDNCTGSTTTRTAGLASGSVFPIGTTTVTHQVTDASGNTASCSFTVTVLTPQTVIQNLQAQVSASSLTGTQKNGLLSKLSAALQALNSGQTNVACNKLSEFLNSVGILVNNGSLASATGTAWISSANHVRNTIGCTNLPCS
jgi:uncharacterized repeat protein (TIGR01451 family)